MDEIWKDVIGYEGLYRVSSLGSVKSVTRYVKTVHKGYEGSRLIKERVLKPYLGKHGYFILTMRKNGRYKTEEVHRLVALAFIPNPDDLPCVNHKDENKQNNSVDNLEWCTRAYNNNYGNRNKKISQSRKGIKFSEEHIKNLSLAHKEIVTDAFRERMRQVHLGTTLSSEHKKKISESVKKAWSKRRS